jgi:type I restriction enzyme M protein
MANLPFKVLDPACGTGGFLVLGMNFCLKEIENKLRSNEIHELLFKDLENKIKEDTFYGIDAHDGVACSAKMNMIIAGDGHNNISCADSLKTHKLVPNYVFNSKMYDDGLAHLILTNPPFGTSEEESLNKKDLSQYDIKTSKGQSLFIQKMILSSHKSSRIVSVIDEGVLNTVSHFDLRTLIMKECRIEYILSLPDETFKPNKINVRSGVLVLLKRESRDEDIEDDYPIKFIRIHSLGYGSAGEEIKGFDLNRLIGEIESINIDILSDDAIFEGYNWFGFKVNLSNILNDRGRRFDMRYWNPITKKKIENLTEGGGCFLIKDINLIETKRGNSPLASEYVSESEGYALVVKAGTNISKNGELLTVGDYIEEGYLKEKYKEDMMLKDGDILLASTGDGTLGKCCVYRNKDEKSETKPAIADGHVTVIRVNQDEIYPEYLCDYLRKGFGSEQVNRLFTGSTGLVEIQPDDVNEIVIPPLPTKETQKAISINLRNIEKEINDIIVKATKELYDAEQEFYSASLPQ